MAEERLGRDFVDDIIGRVTTSLTEYNTDEDHFEEVRIRLGKLWNKRGTADPLSTAGGETHVESFRYTVPWAKRPGLRCRVIMRKTFLLTG